MDLPLLLYSFHPSFRVCKYLALSHDISDTYLKRPLAITVTCNQLSPPRHGLDTSSRLLQNGSKDGGAPKRGGTRPGKSPETLPGNYQEIARKVR
jgi:hypothetical protein